MHIAVDVTGSKVGKDFTDYIDDLVKGGYVTTGTEAVVDKLRQRGNTANHDLPASSESESLTTLTITEHLLRGVYEVPKL